jgi:hypothetical protein
MKIDYEAHERREEMISMPFQFWFYLFPAYICNFMNTNQ